MLEDLAQVLSWDADAIVTHAELDHVTLDQAPTQGQDPIAILVGGHGLSGVADQIDQDLEHLVLLDCDRRHSLVFVHDADARLIETRRVDAHGVSHDLVDIDLLHDARTLRVRLLYGNDDLDVLDVLGEQLNLVLQLAAFVAQGAAHRDHEPRQLLSLRILGQERGDVLQVSAQQGRGLFQQ
jgi:hypothetical protein